jgi:hypothetical protein
MVWTYSTLSFNLEGMGHGSDIFADIFSDARLIENFQTAANIRYLLLVEAFQRRKHYAEETATDTMRQDTQDHF